MGFYQPLTHLFGHTDGCSHAQLFCHPEHTLQIFARHIFHSDVVGSFLFIQIIHAADMFIDNLAGEFQLVAEAGNSSLIRSDLWIQEF